MTDFRQKTPSGFCIGRETRAGGFTLTELLISIAIALILILGINQIFKAASATAGAGQTISAATRDARTIESTIAADFRNFAADPGILIIRPEQRFAWRNGQDKLSDDDGDPRTYLVGTTRIGPISPWMVNLRSHRLDRLGFFARGTFVRQTNGGAPGFGPLSSSEAWIWYGHLAIPNNDFMSGSNKGFTFWNPGSDDPRLPSRGSPDNNTFSCDWVLGRGATLMIPSSTPNPDFNDDPWLEPNTSAKPAYRNIDPLCYSSVAISGNPTFYWKNIAANVPVDIAHLSIAEFQNQLLSAGTPNDWFDLMIGFDTQAMNAFPRVGEFFHAGSPILPNWNNPGLRSVLASLTSDCMVRGCSQVIVEYAGSYLNQDDNPTSPTYGQIRAGAPLPTHKLDFIVDRGLTTGSNDFTTRAPAPLNFPTTRIRWYGMPRHTHGSDSVGNARIDYRDVIPLRDLLQLTGGWRGTGLPAPFERIGANAGGAADTFPGAPGNDPFDTQTFNYYNISTTDPRTSSYVCAWDPSMTALLPKLIRITISIDDPNGRLGDAQTFEYIFSLQQ